MAKARSRLCALLAPLVGVGAAGAFVAACSSSSYGETFPEEASVLESSVVEAGVAETASDGAPDTALPPSSCVRIVAPASAVLAATISFISFSSSSGDSNGGWQSTGYDRDGLCTTAASTDVCRRAPAAPATLQEDGDGGIDNGFGQVIEPLFKGLGLSFEQGYVKTDASGAGSLTLSVKGSTTPLIIPLRATRLSSVQGASATLSGLVPLQALVVALADAAKRADTSLCMGGALDSILNKVRHAADILQDGTQSPSADCDAISLGAVLTGVVTTNVPVFDMPPNPCPIP